MFTVESTEVVCGPRELTLHGVYSTFTEAREKAESLLKSYDDWCNVPDTIEVNCWDGDKRTRLLYWERDYDRGYDVPPAFIAEYLLS